jgi:hypothetical protein
LACRMGISVSKCCQSTFQLQQNALGDIKTEVRDKWKLFVGTYCVLGADQYVTVKTLLAAFLTFIADDKEFITFFEANYRYTKFHQFGRTSDNLFHCTNCMLYYLIQQEKSLCFSKGFCSRQLLSNGVVEPGAYNWLDFIDERVVIGLGVTHFSPSR